MAATPAWLAAFEVLLNRGVAASAQAAVLAGRLDGTALQLDIQGLTSVRIRVIRGHLSLNSGLALDSKDLEPADASISGSPPALLRLAGFMVPSTRPARTAGAAVSGNAEIANSYRELLVLARPDVEEELSRLIGDVPARGLSLFASRTLEWMRAARRVAGENVAEYLQEESRDLVNKPELDEFLQAVDALRETADRVDARIARLERRLKDSA